MPKPSTNACIAATSLQKSLPAFVGEDFYEWYRRSVRSRHLLDMNSFCDLPLSYQEIDTQKPHAGAFEESIPQNCYIL